MIPTWLLYLIVFVVFGGTFAAIRSIKSSKSSFWGGYYYPRRYMYPVVVRRPYKYPYADPYWY